MANNKKAEVYQDREPGPEKPKTPEILQGF